MTCLPLITTPTVQPIIFELILSVWIELKKVAVENDCLENTPLVFYWFKEFRLYAAEKELQSFRL